MTRKEFKIQRALGIFSENFELRFCFSCFKRKLHQRIITGGLIGNLLRCRACGKEKIIYPQF